MGWARAVSAWSLIFAAPHFYWAMGGRRGLGAQAVVADEALSQGWFFAYNLLTGVAAVAAVVGVEVLSRAGRRGAIRFLQVAAWAGCVILTLRGVVGIAALGLELGEGGWMLRPSSSRSSSGSSWAAFCRHACASSEARSNRLSGRTGMSVNVVGADTSDRSGTR